MATYFGGLIFAVIVNRISGIYLLSYGKQILCFAAMLGMAEVFTRYKSSSEIFYSLKELPHP
jgi:lipopolysaccharide export LptBFGC system permease protein LptF